MGVNTIALKEFGHKLERLRHIRAPLLVGIFAALVLSLPDQTRELYRIMAEDLVRPDSIWPGVKVSITLLFLLVVIWGVWLSTTDIALRNHPQAKTTQNKQFGQLLHLLPALLIPIGLAIGIYRTSAHEIPVDALKAFPELEKSISRVEGTLPILAVALGLCLALIAAMITLKIVLRGTRDENTTGIKSYLLCPKFRVRFVASIGIAITTLIVIFKIRFPQFVGTLFIFLNFVLMLALITSVMTAFFDPLKIPSITILLLVAIGLSVTGINDNHVIEKQPRSGENAKLKRSKISGVLIKNASFVKWLGEREDVDFYRNKNIPYPVFIVAAAGGGLYAAHHTAAVLSKLQDRCPNFSQHVFAISGVSGGGLGAAAFVGLARNSKYATNGSWKRCQSPSENKHLFQQTTRKFLEHDFLAPLVGATLFRDLPQRFLPYPFKTLDRARVLETSIEQAWDDAIGLDSSNPFKAQFLEHWDQRSAAPALLLNSTDVDNGLRVVISPFDVQHFSIKSLTRAKYTTLSDFYEYAAWGDQSDLKLSSAVGLSARFPWALPAATIKRPVPKELKSKNSSPNESYKMRLVDGGIFENSGAETAMDVVHALSRYFVFTKEKISKCRTDKDKFTSANDVLNDQNAEPDEKKRSKEILKTIARTCKKFFETQELLKSIGISKGVKIHLLLVDIQPNLVPEPWYGGSEALSPLQALMSTRTMRGHLAKFRLTTSQVPCWDEYTEWTECDPWLVSLMNLDSRHFPLPLGWQMSSNTFDFIEFHSGRAKHGTFQTRRDLKLRSKHKEQLIRADTAACTIELILKGDTFADDWKKKKKNRSTLRPCA